jgi:hypothetical protein
MGFWTSSIVWILKSEEKHDVPESGSVSVLRWGETPILLGPLERANLNHWISDGNRSSFWNVVFLSSDFRIRTMDEVQKPINSVCYTPLSEPYRIY